MENDSHDSALLEAEDPVNISLGPMGSVFQQLRSAIDWQYRKLKGVKTEIQILGEGLEGLCTGLKDLSEAEDTITRCWVRQIRDLCYDTSDYLDELLHFIQYSSGTRPRTRLFSWNRLGSKIFRVHRRPACNQLLLSLPKLKRVHLIAKLSALIARVEDADERRRRFKISPPQASKHHHYVQPAGVSHLFPQLPLQIHVDNVIELLRLYAYEINFKVATIFGSAGVGKTAVARSLYHQYRGRFQYRAFLRVSRDPDMRRLLADLLAQIKAPPVHAFSDVEGLIAIITKHLQGKSYLILIDDLWDISTWDIIRRALPDGDYCTAITTTQIEDVALACCNDQLEHIYEITPLNNDLSGIRADGCTTHASTEGMKEALNLVYNNLPLHLKTCLLYLNIYPEGWTVKKGELLKQWVAEGFIRSVHGHDAEKTAGCYFDALVSSGMVQCVDTNYNDEVLSFTIHHMVLDMIRQKSMEENFVTIVNYFQAIIGLPDKVRRLSVQLGGAKGANNISRNMRISQVRSLVFCGFFKSVPSIVEYGLLQVLILHIWSDRDSIFDLTTIGKLYRLRYLKIDSSITVKLPHKIQRLQQLGTLQVDAGLYAIPSGIVHLQKLLHLSLPSGSILPHGVSRMTSLRTLRYFDLGINSEENVRDLGEFINLQDLQLTCSAVQPAECLEKNMQLLVGSVLKKLSILESVTLVPDAGSSDVNTLQDGASASRRIVLCDASRSVFPATALLWRLELSRRCCIFSRLPKWLGELAQLRILKIAIGELTEEDICILNGLPALASLSLHVATKSTEDIVFGKEGFSVLKYFKYTCSGPFVEFETGAMPHLEKLKLFINDPIQIIIGRLPGLKEISAIIGYAGLHAEFAGRKSILNNPGNPKVQCMRSILGYSSPESGAVDASSSPAPLQQPKTPSSLFKGVVPQPNGRWDAQIYENNSRVWLGSFSSEATAAAAYDAAALRFRGPGAITNFLFSSAAVEYSGSFLTRELSFLNDHSKAEIVDMLRSHTYDDELWQCLHGPMKPPPASAREHLFEKAMTPSDTGKLNRLVVPKQFAEKHFPDLTVAGDKGVLLNFKDGDGKLWRFRYSYWNSSQSYVFTEGWSRFVREKGLSAGDTIMFSCWTYRTTKLFFIDYYKNSTTTTNAVNADENETSHVALNRSPRTKLGGSGVYGARTQMGTERE